MHLIRSRELVPTELHQEMLNLLFAYSGRHLFSNSWSTAKKPFSLNCDKDVAVKHFSSVLQEGEKLWCSCAALLILVGLFCFFPQGFKIDLNCKQLTVDFVNQSVLQISSQDVESKRSDKTDFAEQLGAMNRRWQILQGLITEKVKKKPNCSGVNFQNAQSNKIIMVESLCRSSRSIFCSNRAQKQLTVRSEGTWLSES